MKASSLKLAYFSPTGTTASIVQAIARGMNQSDVEHLDITKPNAREKQLHALKNELLVVAVPVYSGRVPVLLSEWLHEIQLDKTPTVCVVVYGNRDYDDALLELTDSIKERGGVPIACAAFIGEHSFSSPDAPTAVSRPDEADLKQAEIFGRKIREIMQSLASVESAPDIRVPGNYPYKALKAAMAVDFIDVSDTCTQCGVCAALCPVGAIDLANGSLTDIEKCIYCCACIKNCPENARTMKDGFIKDIAVRVSGMCKERKEPVSFF